jgi:4-amino-4-deoxy-L-arabinose transferase-like glycosyltransferase
VDGQLARAVTFDGAAAGVSRRNWLEPMLLALVLTLWFGYELGTRALWAPDEGRYAEIAREMAASGDFVTPRLDGVPYLEKPPLLYWLTAGTMRLFGISEWTARAWPAIFALAGCLVVYFAGRGLYGRRAGLIAAAILALCPLYDFLGRSLTLDMALTAWLTAALSAFLFAARDPDARHRRWLYYAFYVAIAFAILTKGIVALAIPAMVIGAWIALMGEWRLIGRMHLPAGLVIVGAIAGPWHVLAEQANPGFSHFYFVHEHFARFLTTVHHRVQPAWFFVPVIVVGFFPWSAFLPAALRGLRWRERREHREAWFLVLWAAIPFLFFSLSGSKLVPYVLPVLPPLALLLGDRLARAWERNEAPPRAALWALLTMGAAFSAVFAALPTLDSSSTTLRLGCGAARQRLLPARRPLDDRRRGPMAGRAPASPSRGVAPGGPGLGHAPRGFRDRPRAPGRRPLGEEPRGSPGAQARAHGRGDELRGLLPGPAGLPAPPDHAGRVDRASWNTA